MKRAAHENVQPFFLSLKYSTAIGVTVGLMTALHSLPVKRVSFLLVLCCAMWSTAVAQKPSFGATLAYGVHSQLLNKGEGNFALTGEYTFGGYVRFNSKGRIDLMTSIQYGTATFRHELTANTWWVQVQDQLRLFVLAELAIGKKHHLCVGIAPRLGFGMTGAIEERIGTIFPKFSYRDQLSEDVYKPSVRTFQVAPVVGWKYTPAKRLHFFIYFEQDLLPMLNSEVSLKGTYGIFTLFEPERFNPTIFRTMLALQFDISKQ